MAQMHRGRGEFSGAWSGVEAILSGENIPGVQPNDLPLLATAALKAHLDKGDYRSPVTYRLDQSVSEETLAGVLGIFIAATSLGPNNDQAFKDSANRFLSLVSKVDQDRLAKIVWSTEAGIKAEARNNPRKTSVQKSADFLRTIIQTGAIPKPPAQHNVTVLLPVPDAKDATKAAAAILTAGALVGIVPNTAVAQPGKTTEVSALNAVTGTNNNTLQTDPAKPPLIKSTVEELRTIGAGFTGDRNPVASVRAGALPVAVAENQKSARPESLEADSLMLTSSEPPKTAPKTGRSSDPKLSDVIDGDAMSSLPGSVRQSGSPLSDLLSTVRTQDPQGVVRAAAVAVPTAQIHAAEGLRGVTNPSAQEKAAENYRKLVEQITGGVDTTPVIKPADFLIVVQAAQEAVVASPEKLDDGKPPKETVSFANIVGSIITPPAPSSPETPTPNSSADQQQSPSQNVPVRPSMEVAKNQSAISYDFAKLPGDYATEKARNQAKSITEKLENSALHKEVYLQVAKEMGVDPEIIATLHWRETNMSLEYPSNGQGLFQDYGNRGKYPRKGTATKEEFIEQAKWAVNHLAEKIGKENLHKLNHADPEFDLNLVREAFLKYNGLGGNLYRNQAGDKALYHGSPYVMNLYSDEYDSKKNPNWKQFLSDGGNVGPANQAIGATTLYEALIAISNFGIAPAQAPASAPETAQQPVAPSNVISNAIGIPPQIAPNAPAPESPKPTAEQIRYPYQDMIDGMAKASELRTKYGGKNRETGHLPDSVLEPLGPQYGNKGGKDVYGVENKLIKEAAVAYRLMDDAYFKETGKHLSLNNTYRPIEVQRSLADSPYAADPGTSPHGSGVAIDFDMPDSHYVDYEGNIVEARYWLNENSWKYGFVNPANMQYSAKHDKPNRLHETWHMNFYGNQAFNEMKKALKYQLMDLGAKDKYDKKVKHYYQENPSDELLAIFGLSR